MTSIDGVCPCVICRQISCIFSKFYGQAHFLRRALLSSVEIIIKMLPNFVLPTSKAIAIFYNYSSYLFKVI